VVEKRQQIFEVVCIVDVPGEGGGYAEYIKLGTLCMRLKCIVIHWKAKHNVINCWLGLMTWAPTTIELRACK